MSTTTTNLDRVIQIGDRQDTIRNHVLDRLGQILDGTSLPYPSALGKAKALSIVWKIQSSENSMLDLDDDHQILIAAYCEPTKDDPDKLAQAQTDAAKSEFAKTTNDALDAATLTRIVVAQAKGEKLTDEDQTALDAASAAIADAKAALDQKLTDIGAVAAEITP